MTAPIYTSACPSCSANLAGGEAPVEGNALVCPFCTDLLLWDEDDHGWRAVNDDERAYMLELPEIIDAMVQAQAFAEYRLADRNAIAGVIMSIAPHIGKTASLTAANALVQLGFHSAHPDESERPE